MQHSLRSLSGPTLHTTSCSALCYRVSARAELSIRQRLSQREDRISELKDALAAVQSHQPERPSSHPRGRLPSPQPHNWEASRYAHDSNEGRGQAHTSSQPPHSWDAAGEALGTGDVYARRHLEAHARPGRFRPDQLAGRHPPNALSPEASESRREEEERLRPASPRAGTGRFQGALSPGAELESHGDDRGAGQARESCGRLPYFQPGSHAPRDNTDKALQSQTSSQVTMAQPVGQASMAVQPAPGMLLCVSLSMDLVGS